MKTILVLSSAVVVALSCIAAAQGCATVSCDEDGDRTCVPSTDGGGGQEASIIDASHDGGALDGSNDGNTADVATDGNGLDTGLDGPPPCDVTKSPAQDGCVLTDTLGIFVAPAPIGSDANPGTRAAPVSTIGHAVQLAKLKAAHRVYVCAATFTDPLVLTDSANDFGVSIYGGLACPSSAGDGGSDASSGSWAYVGDPSTVAPSSIGYALRIDGFVKPIRFEGISFTSLDAVSPGESSIAVFVSHSTSVSFAGATITAGSGKDGSTGTNGSNWTPVDPSDVTIAGHDASNADGGTTQDCLNLCTNGVHSTGGAGGAGSPTQPVGGAAGGPSLGGGAGGFGACAAGGIGHDGNAAPAAAGGAGTLTWGTLDANGWTSATPIAGTAGGPGQGGGGGSGGISTSKGGGGGGACGGCGGGGGTAGTSGGSSFALLSLNSTVSVSNCVLHANNAGAGGKGGDGQIGQTGGNGGLQSSGGCTGGGGGSGGTGGGAGGGAGGISAAIGYVGTAAPTQSNGTTTTVATGASLGGAAGANGSPAASKGKDGVALAVVNLQ